MRVAIMQPYLFPYLGYFQLIKSVDVFVFYDDVNFIKQGWINRNKIGVSKKEFIFTIPIKEASSFKTIRDTQVNLKLFFKWKLKFLLTLKQSYKKAPYFEIVYRLVEDLFNSDYISISEFAMESIIKTSNYLRLNTNFLCSSNDYADTKFLDRESRLIEIIKRNNANSYINPIGGQELYTKDSFEKRGIKLNFIKSAPLEYKQFDNEFLPWLSVIDVLMFNSPEEINWMLDQYELV